MHPIAVDRVLADGAATYLQYHFTGSAGPSGDLLPPMLSDEQGATVEGDGSGGYASSISRDWTSHLLSDLPAWVPWRPPRPPTVWRGYYVIGASLPASARVVVLQFGAYGVQGTQETVRVPLNLQALAHRHLAYPGMRARASGLTLTLQELGFAHLTYTYVLPRDSATDVARVLLKDSAGRAVPAIAFSPHCIGDMSATGSLDCNASIAFSPQRSGTRLMLVIAALSVNGRPRVGPWRFSTVIP